MNTKSLVPWRRGGRVPARREEDPFTALQREMNELFEDFFGGFPRWPELPPFDRGVAPRVDVTETENEITVSAELPGVDQKDIEVEIDNESLTIKGEKKEEKEEKGKGYYRAERSYGSFRRTIPLPCAIDVNKVTASHKKGVLSITLPKAPEAKKKV